MYANNTHVCAFLPLARRVVEHKVRTTYEDLAALGQEDLATILAPQPSGEDQAQGNQESYKGARMRFGKRRLVLVGALDIKLFLLVWMVVAQVVMVIHYKFFKHCTWYSHSKEDTERLTIMDFCLGVDGLCQRPCTTCPQCCSNRIVFEGKTY